MEGGGYVSFEEAFICVKSSELHPILKSCYVELILVMFVAVGNNRSFLDHLCYSFVSLTLWLKLGSECDAHSH